MLYSTTNTDIFKINIYFFHHLGSGEFNPNLAMTTIIYGKVVNPSFKTTICNTTASMQVSQNNKNFMLELIIQFYQRYFSKNASIFFCIYWFGRSAMSMAWGQSGSL